MENEYRVGSIADLLSGTITPNKPKVIKRTIGQVTSANDDYNPASKKQKLARQNNSKVKNKKNKNKFGPSYGDTKSMVVIDGLNIPAVTSSVSTENSGKKKNKNKGIVVVDAVTETIKKNNKKKKNNDSSVVFNGDVIKKSKKKNKKKINTENNNDSVFTETVTKKKNKKKINTENYDSVTTEIVIKKNKKKINTENQDSEITETVTKKKNKKKISTENQGSEIIEAVTKKKNKKKIDTERDDSVITDNVTKKKKKNKKNKSKAVDDDEAEQLTFKNRETTKNKAASKKTHIDNVNLDDDAVDSDSSTEESPKTNASKKKHQQKSNKIRITDTPEINARTVFVGNMTINASKIQIKKLFGKYGTVESVRMRCIAPLKQGMTKREAAHEKKFHKERETLNVYVKYEKREDAIKAATELNGFRYNGHRIRTQTCDSNNTTPSIKKAIFIGNLPYNVEEDELWNAFESCGSIHSVRVIRDSEFRLGIGIGYVNFTSPDSVELALQMEEVKIKNNTIRVQRCVSQNLRNNKKNKKFNTKKEKGNNFKNKKYNEGIVVKKRVFRGKTTDGNKNKKRKLNKDFAKKLKLSKKIAPRS